MTEQLRARIVARQPEPRLMGKVECDEVYVVAGHKGGHPDAVKKRAARGGAVVVRMLGNVQQATIRPLIERFIAPGTRVHTDEYHIYHRLTEWGFDHHTVCHLARKIAAPTWASFSSYITSASGVKVC